MSQRDPQYEEARRRFDDLDVEGQVHFLIEATASTLAQGGVKAGQVLADGTEDVLRDARRGSSASRSGPGAAEPETAQRQAPHSGALGVDQA